MTRHILHLPSAIAMHQIGSILARTTFFPKNPSQFIVRFHPKKTHLDPMGIALLGAWASYWLDRGVDIQCENLSSSGLVYAARVGLFKVIGTSFPREVQAHEEAGRFVELTQIQTQDDLSRLCAAIGGVLRAPHLIEFVQYVLVEMTRNALEHAGASAFVCAQFYPKDKRVTIGVADCGRGIRESLRANYDFSSDALALLASMRPGVSGTTRIPYSSADNAGLGLFYARGVAKASSRSFVLFSGSSAYKQRATQAGAMPSHNPEDETHDLLQGLPPWQGTVVGVNIRGFEAKLQSFMARMKPVLNVGAGMRRAPKLNFT